jgi:folylpolyglutamate synthase/dihydropteroate synthase
MSFLGLVECKWLGRNQQIKRKQLTYYLDGAHTVESIEVKNLFTSDNFRFGNNI